jgi:hypothetical protein
MEDSAEIASGLKRNSFFWCKVPASPPLFINPTHERTEGRAPAWSSEFNSKYATLQGGPAETAAGLNVTLWVSVTARRLVVVVSSQVSGTAEPNRLFEYVWTFETHFASNPKDLAR